MLVLSRKEGERIMIGQDIVVTILDVRGDRIRIGVAAPMEVPVHREEVYHRQQGQQWLQLNDTRPDESRFHAECA